MDYESAVETAPTRPALRFYGGGWRRALWTIAHFPAHDIYCEPCFGAGSVLLRKPPCKLEIANDLDNRVVNFFQSLRDYPDLLLPAIRLTPWHEEEFQRCLFPAREAVEDARRFFFACWGSIKGGPSPGLSDFRWQKTMTRRSAAVMDVATLDHLLVVAARLKNVQFMKRDGLEIIRKMRGTGALIYFDPPYLSETRTRKNGGYLYEPAADWHIRAADLLRDHDGPVVVAGYPSALYEDLFTNKGWQVVRQSFPTNSGGRREECLWVKGDTRYGESVTNDE